MFVPWQQPRLFTVRHFVWYRKNRHVLGYLSVMLVVMPLSSKVEFSRVETRSKFPKISLFSMRFFWKRGAEHPWCCFMTRFFSKRGKSIPRCYALFSFLFILFGVVATENFYSWSANDILSEINSLIEMPSKKLKLVWKWLSECNAAHRWSAKKVDFAAVINGESNFAEAKWLTLTAPGRPRQLTLERLHSYWEWPRQHCVAIQSSLHGRLTRWTPWNLTTMLIAMNRAVETGASSTSANWTNSSLTSPVLPVTVLEHYPWWKMDCRRWDLPNPFMFDAHTAHTLAVMCIHHRDFMIQQNRMSHLKLTLMTMLIHELGKGHGALQTVQKVLGVNNMHIRTFQRHNRTLQKACQSVADTNLDTAAEVIRGVYGDLMDNVGVIYLTVSYDGTWQKRGFTSHQGVGVIIEVQTGLVIDYEVLSNYCHACALAENRLGAGTPEFETWQAAHIVCERNFDGDGSRGCQMHLEPLCGGVLVSIHTHPERWRFEYISCSDAVGTLWARSHHCQAQLCQPCRKENGNGTTKGCQVGEVGWTWRWLVNHPESYQAADLLRPCTSRQCGECRCNQGSCVGNTFYDGLWG